ncbi:unnamed protein product [Heterosigma akashiwo]
MGLSSGWSSTCPRARPPTASTLRVAGAMGCERCQALTAATGAQARWKEPTAATSARACASTSGETYPYRLQSPDHPQSIAASRPRTTAPWAPIVYNGLWVMARAKVSGPLAAGAGVSPSSGSSERAIRKGWGP